MNQQSELGDLFLKHPALGVYFRSIAGVVQALGTPDFEERLMAFLSDVVPVDHCAVFTYSEKGEAGHLFTHSRMPDREAEELARDYVEKFHAQDPNFQEMKDKALDDKVYYRFSRRGMSEGYDPAYQNHFFDRSGLIDKASTIGRIENGQVYCNFYRMSDSTTYSAEDWEALKDLMPLATALVAAHYDLARSRGHLFMDNGSENIVRKSIVHNVISSDNPLFSVLTDRERQVCERILLGFTTTGIGLDLNIAPTSVATYRKRAYSKLGISSQNELFSLCLRAAENSPIKS
ncbi:helix-turn-helix transcriptional regulator [Kordiimonas sediminis]|nr:LuxR C-terminal-related transcriptional regulator [Kordiimonas sediminis]